MADGSLRISTRLDNSKIDKDIAELTTKTGKIKKNMSGIAESMATGLMSIVTSGAILAGVTGVYGMLSLAAKSWANDNSTAVRQIKSDIDYMKSAVGTAVKNVLTPIIEYIVNLLYKALAYAGALIKAFTGIDVFAGSVADYMSSTTSSARKTNQELKKQLTSFDKINKLNENKSSGSGIGGSGKIMPSQDLSNAMGKYTEQAEKMKEIFEDIKDYVLAIGAGIAAWKIADALGASGKLSLALGLTAAGLTFFWKGIKGFQDGEITNADIFKTIAGIIGVGVGVTAGANTLGLAFSASALLGLSVMLFFADWAIASYGQSTVPDWIEELLGTTDISGAGTSGKGLRLMEKLGIPKEVRFDISISLFFVKGMIEGMNNIFPGLKEQLLKSLKWILLDVANAIEKIPIIGEGIARAIRAGVEASESEMTETIESTTTTSLDSARAKINKKAMETGGEAGTNWMSEMKNKINSDANNLRSTMEETVTDASEESKTIIEERGLESGNSFINKQKEGISLNKQQLGETIKETISEASNSNMAIAEEKGRELSLKQIDGMKAEQKNQQAPLTTNLSGVIKEANNNVDTSNSKKIGTNIVSGINDGIKGNKWTLSTTMQNLATGMLSAFKNILGIHSPSKEMASLAKFVPLGIAEGIDSTSDKAIESMKELVSGIEDTASNMDIQYNIPKIPRNAVTYIPRQSISTNEIQRSIVGEDGNILNKLLSDIQGIKGNKTITIPLIIDGEEFIRKTIELNENYNLATNGGGL